MQEEHQTIQSDNSSNIPTSMLISATCPLFIRQEMDQTVGFAPEQYVRTQQNQIYNRCAYLENKAKTTTLAIGFSVNSRFATSSAITPCYFLSLSSISSTIHLSVKFRCDASVCKRVRPRACLLRSLPRKMAPPLYIVKM